MRRVSDDVGPPPHMIGALEGEYKLAIPPYYFSLIDPDDPVDPIRLQSVTSPLEAENPSGYELSDPSGPRAHSRRCSSDRFHGNSASGRCGARPPASAHAVR